MMHRKYTTAKQPPGTYQTQLHCRGAHRKKGSRIQGRQVLARANMGKQGFPSDPYQTLGLKPDCTQKDIKAAYRKLAKVHHPDSGGDPKTFMTIAKAYAILSRPDTREEYDRRKKYPSYNSANSTWPYSNTRKTTRKEEEEDFYGLGDLFRDIEEEFNKNAKSGGASVWQKLGEDLLDFLEETGETVDPKGYHSATNRKQKSEQKVHKSFDVEEELEQLKREMGDLNT